MATGLSLVAGGGSLAPIRPAFGSSPAWLGRWQRVALTEGFFPRCTRTPPPPSTVPLPTKAWGGAFCPARFGRRCPSCSPRLRATRGGLGSSLAQTRSRQAAAVGAGADGDPRGRADLPAGHRRGWWKFWRAHPCHCARCPIGAVGDGGGPKMRRPGSRDRRTVGRPRGARFYRDPAACGCSRTVGRAGLAGAAWRFGQFQRGADALASGECAEPCPSVRSARFWRSGMGRRIVPCTRNAARPVEPGPWR